jgi:hypothetical protein
LYFSELELQLNKIYPEMMTDNIDYTLTFSSKVNTGANTSFSVCIGDGKALDSIISAFQLIKIEYEKNVLLEEL